MSSYTFDHIVCRTGSCRMNNHELWTLASASEKYDHRLYEGQWGQHLDPWQSLFTIYVLLGILAWIGSFYFRWAGRRVPGVAGRAAGLYRSLRHHLDLGWRVSHQPLSDGGPATPLDSAVCSVAAFCTGNMQRVWTCFLVPFDLKISSWHILTVSIDFCRFVCLADKLKVYSNQEKTR